jgi:hypothetical protein
MEWISSNIEILTILVTILGFIVTYFLNKQNYKNEIIKFKKNSMVDSMKEIPFELCELMYSIQKGGDNGSYVQKLATIYNKIIAYGSVDSLKITSKLQQVAYQNAKSKGKIDFSILCLSSLLITQLKYDMSSEVVSPEYWFIIKISDYNAEMKESIKSDTNRFIDELALNKDFKF